MKAFLAIWLMAADWSLLAAAQEQMPGVVVVVGAEGTPEYGKQFREWAERWRQAAGRGTASCVMLGLDEPAMESDRANLQAILARLEGESSQPLWLVLIGHGTFDGKTARFNLRGPDVTSKELALWLGMVKRPCAIVNCTSGSGPFIGELSGPKRIVVTATRSGQEQNFARFGDYISSAITDSRADLDKDEQTSLLEAWLLAASRVREFYDGEGRLATEHALLDDNGDGRGTPADWFTGLRPVKSTKDGDPLDGTLASQFVLVPNAQDQRLSEAARARRDALEHSLAQIRLRKSQLAEADYLLQVEPILTEIARLYAQVDAGDP